jgi:hypothetical protein
LLASSACEVVELNHRLDENALVESGIDGIQKMLVLRTEEEISLKGILLSNRMLGPV